MMAWVAVVALAVDVLTVARGLLHVWVQSMNSFPIVGVRTSETG